MCGILGTTRTNPGTTFPEALDRIQHRGPDGSGTLEDSLVTLGHVRLSIIDLETGAQPMESACGNLVVTFNGEIYNYRELRFELEGQGRVFRTSSDTEVLLHGYAEWGTDILSRLRGMFGFGLADLRRRRLLLARDPLGIKPLVYSWCGGAFSFCSEIQGLLAFPWVRKEVAPNTRAIIDCLDFGYSSSPQSAYVGIEKLPPGHSLIVDLDSPGEPRIPTKFWSFAFEPDESISDEECAELVDETLRESVKAHLVSDVPFGAFLSGGLDSTLVTSYMAELLEEPATTFSIGFRSEQHDETGYARLAADVFGTEHHERILDEESLDLVPELVRHYGEPFSDPSAVPTWHVSRLAREHVPMVLTGDGGDEWFAGYTGRYGEWLESLDPARHPRALRAPWKNLIRGLFSACFPERFPQDPEFPPRASAGLLADQSRYFSRGRIGRLLEREILAESDPVPNGFVRAFEESRGTANLSRAQYADIGTYLPEDILCKVDIASMMHGLETRTPLVDIRVAEMAARIPWERLFGRDEGESEWSGKRPFRAILGKHFDSSFLDRRKMGFSIPQEKWLFDSAKGREIVDSMLLGSGSPLRGWVRQKEMKRIVDERQSWQAWHLLILAEWLKQSGF